MSVSIFYMSFMGIFFITPKIHLTRVLYKRVLPFSVIYLVIDLLITFYYSYMFFYYY